MDRSRNWESGNAWAVLPKHKTSPCRNAGKYCWLGIALLCGVLSLAQHASAQSVPRAPKFYLNKNDITLPIMLDPRVSKTTREVRLFVKNSAKESWKLYTRAHPAQKAFSFRAPHDGEYWFAVSTIDMQGRSNVKEPNKLKTGAIVILDTQGPRVELERLSDSPDGICIRCTVKDANPDPLKTRVSYQTADRRWRVLDAPIDAPDTFCIPKEAKLTGMLRVDAMDRCANSTRSEVHLQDLQKHNGLPPQVAQDQPEKQQNTPVPKEMLRGQVPQLPKEIPQRNMFGPHSNDIGPKSGRANENDPGLPKIPPPIETQPEKTSSQSGVGAKFPPIKEVQRRVAQRIENPSTEPRLTNDRNVDIQYALREAGPTLRKVEIWVTKDDGRTWKRLGFDADSRSPAEIVLPQEGRYGFRLVGYNAAGKGGTPPPRPGDAPERVVEVDMTPPQVAITSVTPIQSTQSGLMLISWKATDKNLGKTPISLYYSPKRNGPWSTMVKDIPNVGYFTWKMPKSAGNGAYVRIVVADKAGNVTDIHTSEAAELPDGKRPVVQIVDILPSSRKR